MKYFNDSFEIAFCNENLQERKTINNFKINLRKEDNSSFHFYFNEEMLLHELQTDNNFDLITPKSLNANMVK